MIIADSSVWIDSFNGLQTPPVMALARLLDGTDLIMGDLILVEVLQGIRADTDFQRIRNRFRGEHPGQRGIRSVIRAEHPNTSGDQEQRQQTGQHHGNGPQA